MMKVVKKRCLAAKLDVALWVGRADSSMVGPSCPYDEQSVFLLSQVSTASGCGCGLVMHACAYSEC